MRRVRFAPSPTGSLHVGNALTAAANRAFGDWFLLRIDLDELGMPKHDVQLDLTRIRRLAVEAIGAMPDEELAACVGVPPELVPAVRGARDLEEAREYAHQILEPEPVQLPAEARPTLERFESSQTVTHARPCGS